MENVYILYHCYEVEVNESFREYIKVIGIYSTEKKTLEAIERLKNLPGFKEYPENFSIVKYEKHEINQVNWTSGFG